MTTTVANQNTQAQIATAPDAPSFQIQRIYLKGISLEMPHAPQIFLEQGEMAMDLQLNSSTKALDAAVSEVALRATLTAKLGNKVVYLLEIDQAGIFEVKNLTAEQTAQALEITGNSILTNYVRTQITDTLQRAMLPLFILPELNWAQAYQERVAAVASAANVTVH